MNLKFEGILENVFSYDPNPYGNIEIQSGLYFSRDEKCYRLFYHLTSNQNDKKYKIINSYFEKISELPNFFMVPKSENNLVELPIRKCGNEYILPKRIHCKYFYTNLNSEDPININYEKLFPKN